MCPSRPLNHQAGAGLPVAIFIITVLALLVLGMSQLQESSGQAVSLQIQSQRAFFAAESGAQTVLADILPADSSQPVSCPSSNPVEIEFVSAGLASCEASVACDAANSPVLVLSSRGSCGGGIDAASRTVEIRLR